MQKLVCWGIATELKLFGLKNAIHHPKFLGRERYSCAPNLGMAVVFNSCEAPNMQKKFFEKNLPKQCTGYYRGLASLLRCSLSSNVVDSPSNSLHWLILHATTCIHCTYSNLKCILFRTKYEKVLEQSQMMWQYERFRIISDFRSRWFANLDVLLSPIKYYRYRRMGEESKYSRELCFHYVNY